MSKPNHNKTNGIKIKGVISVMAGESQSRKIKETTWASAAANLHEPPRIRTNREPNPAQFTRR
ncbi:hypothetical protein PAAG_07097 [Paracoccidioides lutzii Pb01]|uniref:Uncharacterized protein n=1 Tax=Paracoccidioides lutzii (strain ATCC MYA-826 / Pb01) TaxID=502779 RepID=C1H8K6_PARBA|nr:hypothetical protein PAAG_07097 [Paracoccidioides lutzii Pb01]EEH36679.2 hypothetical protein PAAG_07097 [Paracoccidioides lutzii Pb01]